MPASIIGIHSDSSLKGPQSFLIFSLLKVGFSQIGMGLPRFGIQTQGFLKAYDTLCSPLAFQEEFTQIQIGPFRFQLMLLVKLNGPPICFDSVLSSSQSFQG